MLVQITWWKENECVGCDEVEFDSCWDAEQFIGDEQDFINTVSNRSYDRVEMRCPEADLGLSTDY